MRLFLVTFPLLFLHHHSVLSIVSIFLSSIISRVTLPATLFGSLPHSIIILSFAYSVLSMGQKKEDAKKAMDHQDHPDLCSNLNLRSFPPAVGVWDSLSGLLDNLSQTETMVFTQSTAMRHKRGA